MPELLTPERSSIHVMFLQTAADDESLGAPKPVVTNPVPVPVTVHL